MKLPEARNQVHHLLDSLIPNAPESAIERFDSILEGLALDCYAEGREDEQEAAREHEYGDVPRADMELVDA